MIFKHSENRKKIAILLMMLTSMVNSCSPKNDSLVRVDPISTTAATPTFHAQTTYYVDNKIGSDSYSGTQAQPWKSIQKAANTALPGNIVQVQPGAYDEDVQVNTSGMSSAPIVFQANGTVVTNGFVVNANYITIKGFEVATHSLDSTTGWGIYLTGSNDVIENNYIHDTTWGGVILFANISHPALSTNNTIQYNKIYHVGEVGIDVRGRNNLVQYNDISAVMQYPSWMTNPPGWADANGILFFGQGHILRGNYIHDISYTQPENIDPHIDCFQTFRSSPSQEAANNILIEGNRCDNAQFTTRGGHGSGKGFTLQNVSNITIENNVIMAYMGIVADQESQQIIVLNNDFISETSLSTVLYPTGITLNNVPGAIIENNIFYNQPSTVISIANGPAPIASHNLMYRSDGVQLQSSNQYDHSNDFWGVDPMFINPIGIANGNYQLQAGSPAIGSGMDDGVTTDFSGNPRPKGKGLDIGAYQTSTK